MTDDWIRRALDDAVSEVEPRETLDSIRARTRRHGSRRGWVWAGGGALVGVAASLLAVALLTTPDPTRTEPGPAESPSVTVTPSPTQESPSPTSTEPPPAGETVAAGIYYAGDTPHGPRLFREFHRVDAGNRLLAGVLDAMAGTPEDPDYRTLWPQLGDSPVEAVHVDGAGQDRLIQISLATDALHDRPAGMTEQEAELAVQQVVYTTQAVAGSRAPVQFLRNGNPVDQVLGVPTSEPLANAPQLDVLALVNVTNPASGAVVSGEFVADGVASSFEATVPWQIRRGDTVVKEGFATAEGWADRLYPWRATVDVSDLPPGEYNFVAMTDDPSGGTEGPGPTEDTKQITIE